MAADEIERFRRDIVERTGDARAAETITDQELLREVMNTVGKKDQLGAGIRCVVSVSMLTEGWDANNVTHILGIRAFGTQLLCEQVIGRALRRQSYDLNEDNLFDAEYADIFGVPFDFTAKPVVAPPSPPRETVQVKAVRPDRDHLEIRFPRVEGYRVELPTERLTATFNADSVIELTPDLVGPTNTRNQGIIGETADMTVEHLQDVRPSTLLFHLTKRLVYKEWRDAGEDPKLHLFGQLKRITKQWLDTCLVCKGGTYPALLLYEDLADAACNRITAGITTALQGQRPIKALLDPYNPSRAPRRTSASRRRSPIAGTRAARRRRITSTGWCSTASGRPSSVASSRRIRAWRRTRRTTTSDSRFPIAIGSDVRRYRPDFIVLVDDGHGPDDLLRLVVETKGYRREDAKDKKLTMDTYWVPGVNNLGTFGRWAFAELTDVYQMEADFEAKVAQEFNRMIDASAPAVEQVG